ncbi:MAG: hypothetical protein ACFFD4_11280 [Candidatus Odinarchaeota archaeon]
MSSDVRETAIEKAKANEAGMKWKKAAENWLKAASLSDDENALAFRLKACDALLKKEGVKDFIKNVEIFEECITFASREESKKEFAGKLADYISTRLSLLVPKEDEDDLALANEKLGKALELVGKVEDAHQHYKEAAKLYLAAANASLLLEKKKSLMKAADFLAGACRTFRLTKEDKEALVPLKKINEKAIEFAAAAQSELSLHFLDLYSQLDEEKNVLKLQLEVADLLQKNEKLKEDLDVSSRAGKLAEKLADKKAAEDLATKLMGKAKELFESKRSLSYDYLNLASQIHIGAGNHSQVAAYQADYAKQFYQIAGGLFAGQDRERAWSLRESSVNLFSKVGDLINAGQLDYELGVLAAANSDFSKAIELFCEADASFKKSNSPENRLIVVEALRKHIPELIARKKIELSQFSSTAVQILQELDEQDKLGDLYSEMATATFGVKDYAQHFDLLSQTVDQYLKSNKEKARMFGSTVEERAKTLVGKSPEETLKLLDLHIKLFKAVEDLEPSTNFAMDIATSLINAKHYSSAVSATEQAYNLSNNVVSTYWESARNLFNTRVYQTALELFTRTKEVLIQKKDVNASRKLAKELEQLATREEKALVKTGPELKQAYINLAFSVYESLSLAGEKGDLYLAEARRHFENKDYSMALQNYSSAAAIYIERDHSVAANVAETLLSNGQQLMDEKRFDEARSYFEASASTYSDMKDSINQARVYAAQGIGLVIMKRLEDGIAEIERSAKIFFDDNKHIKAGEVYQQAGQTLISVGREDVALDIFIKASEAFRDIKAKKNVISLGQVMERFMGSIAKSKRKKELYDRYFETVKSFYTELDLQEQLGDLYVAATRKALELKTNREEVTELSQQAANYYGVEHSQKVQPLIDVFVEYTKKYLEEEEYVKSAELSEQAVEMLLDGGKDEEAANLAAKQSLYLIKHGAVDPGIGVLEKAASLYEMLDEPLKVGEILFEGAVVLAGRDQFATSLANISRAVAIYEEHDDFDKIKEIANQCVMIAEDLTSKNNDRASKLYIDQSAELYELPGMAVDKTATAIYSDYTDKLLDSMTTAINKEAMRVRRKKKRKRNKPAVK